MNKNNFRIPIYILMAGYTVVTIILVMFIIQLPTIYESRQIDFNSNAKVALEQALQNSDLAVLKQELAQVVVDFPMELVVEKNGGPLFQTIPITDFGTLRNLLNKEAIFEEAAGVVQVGGQQYKIWYSIYRMSDKEYIQTIFFYQTILIGVTILISMVVSLIVQRHLIRPLSKIKKTLKKLEDYELDSIEGGDDVLNKKLDLFAKKLKKRIQGYNKKQTELEYKLEHERNTLSNTVLVSRAFIHDLKSPLHQTLLENEEVLENKTLQNKALKALAKYNMERADQSLKTINEVLSVMDSNGLEIINSNDEVDIIALFSEIKNEFNYLMAKKNLFLLVEIPETLIIYVNRTAMKLTLHNLFSNVTQYSKEDTEIYISIYVEHKILYIVFENEAKKKDIERLNMYGNSYELIGIQETGYSSGNGLYLLKEVSELYDGVFTLTTGGDKVRATITLPIPKES